MLVTGKPTTSSPYWLQGLHVLKQPKSSTMPAFYLIYKAENILGIVFMSSVLYLILPDQTIDQVYCYIQSEFYSQTTLSWSSSAQSPVSNQS